MQNEYDVDLDWELSEGHWEARSDRYDFIIRKMPLSQTDTPEKAFLLDVYDKQGGRGRPQTIPFRGEDAFNRAIAKAEEFEWKKGRKW